MAKWGMVIDLDKCVGCQACVVACKEENNVPHGSPEEQKSRREIYWHKMIAVTKGKYPHVRTEIIPMPCMQCDHPPCVTVCPAKATFQREDGIVVQYFRRCIGCKYCMVACPYGARSFNYKAQAEKAYHRQDEPPDRKSWDPWPFPVRTQGVVEKCTFCAERIGLGREPACVEAVQGVVGGAEALTFGNLSDPRSEVSRILREKRTLCRQIGFGTRPNIYYIV